MAGYRVISSDNHVMEPPDLWADRIDAKFRDRAPVHVGKRMATVGIAMA